MVLKYALHVHFSVDGLRCLNGSNENSDGFSGYSGNCMDLNFGAFCGSLLVLCLVLPVGCYLVDGKHH